jgi:hypothetical protein
MEDSATDGLAAIRRRLDDPATGEKVGRLLDRLDQIENILDRVEMLNATIPAAISTATDTFDDLAKRGQQQGVDIDERLAGALHLAERLTDPKTVDVLSQLVDRMDQLKALLDLADQAPGFMAMAVDTVDRVIQRAEEAGIDVDARLRSTYGLGEKLTSPATVDALGAVLDPGAVQVVGMLGQTLAKCREDCLSKPEPPQAGLLDLYRMSKTEDGRRAIAFLKNFGRLWGEGIEQMHATHRASLMENTNDEIEAKNEAPNVNQ